MAFEILASDDFEVGKHGNAIRMGTIQILKKKQDRTFMSQQATYVIKNEVTEVAEIDEDAYRSGWGTVGWGTLREKRMMWSAASSSEMANQPSSELKENTTENSRPTSN